MLGLPKKTLLAIEAVLDIAYHSGGVPVQSSDITARQGIARRSLEPLLQQLTRAGILSGVRGPRGGYRLGRERRRITVGEIVRLVAGPTTEEIADACGSELGQKVVQPLWGVLNDEVMARLDGLTLEDLCRSARDAGIASDAAKTLDFTI
ncbi:MAG: Rrf2 family transcriptional regulator [Alphaproteobacteria bacterium]|nr:Rrf2 family transcriptional regulator [Alphaproteobacteria bacterium]